MRDILKERTTWRILGVFLLALIVAVGIYEHKGNIHTSTSHHVAQLPRSGYQMPSFTLSELPEGTVNTKQLQGKPIFINFWTSWCTYCRIETPDIIRAYQKYGKQVVFVSINVTSQDNLSSAKSFIKHYGMSWPIALDKTGNVAREYDVVAFPSSFFVNRQGVIVATNLGPLSKQTLDDELEKISR